MTTNKTVEQLALEFAEIHVPYRPWVDQVSFQEDAKIRKIVQDSYHHGYLDARKAEWLLMKEKRNGKLK